MTVRKMWFPGLPQWLVFCIIAMALTDLRAKQALGGDRVVDLCLERFEFNETHMGSPVLIVLYTKDADTAKKTAKLAFERMAELDRIFSDYNSQSELMKLVENFATEKVAPQPVSPDLYAILERSLAISQATNGAFDVTAAPVIRQWRRARRDRKIPTPKNLTEAMSKVDFRRIHLFPDSKTVQLEPGTRIDLGGIAKGYAAVAVLNRLTELGAPHALVSVAGDIAVGKAPPDRSGWRIEVSGLNPSKDKPLTTLELENATISTSGDAERFVEIDGRRFSHIVNPKTGLGVERRATVTVVGSLDQSVDAYATSLYLLGAQGTELLGSINNPPDLSIIWLEESVDGKHEIKTNSAFNKIKKVD